ncbi:MAG: IPT/TIG domain-containing protein [Ignavibacteria bacterium]|nr:IPT/TIG domain-containing protein [Ignavibacteria bacterium]
MRFTRLLFCALFSCASFVSLHAQSMTTATVLRPYITSIFPQSLLTGADSTVLTINGKRFQRGAAVYFNARKLTNVRIDGDSVIVVVIPGELTVNADVAVLLVENPDETKIGMRVRIFDACFPGPAIDVFADFAIAQPITTNATMQAFTLRIAGAGFSLKTRVEFNGVPIRFDPRSTNATFLLAEVPAYLNVPGSYFVRVQWEGGCAKIKPFTILPALDTLTAPVVTRISPPYFLPSGGNVIIVGLNFSSQATVRLGNTTLAIVSISSDRIAVIIPPNLPLNGYLLSVTNPSGQSAVTTIFNPIGVSNLISATTISPNPVTTALTLETTLDRATTLTLTLRNILGEAVLQEHHTIASGRFTATLDVSTLANGVYLLEMSDGAGGRWVQKVVKY